MPLDKPYVNKLSASLDVVSPAQVVEHSNDPVAQFCNNADQLQQINRPRPYQLPPKHDLPHPSVQFTFNGSTMDEADRPFYGLI